MLLVKSADATNWSKGLPVAWHPRITLTREPKAESVPSSQLAPRAKLTVVPDEVARVQNHANCPSLVAPFKLTRPRFVQFAGVGISLTVVAVAGAQIITDATRMSSVVWAGIVGALAPVVTIRYAAASAWRVGGPTDTTVPDESIAPVAPSAVERWRTRCGADVTAAVASNEAERSWTATTS